MARPVIAVDKDDVSNHFHEGFVPYVLAQHGIETDYEKFVSYDFRKDLGITHEQMTDWVMDIVLNHSHHILPNIPALSALKQIAEHAELIIVTSRCEDMEEATMAWIDAQAPGLFSEAHFLNGMSTNYPERRRKKSEVCREIGAVVMIEDHSDNAEDVARELGIPIYMPVHPWNRKVSYTESELPIRKIRNDESGWQWMAQNIMQYLT